jgi:hypothetical protein
MFDPDLVADLIEQFRGVFSVVLLSEILGGAIISPHIKTMGCGEQPRLYTSKVPYKVFFRVST